MQTEQETLRLRQLVASQHQELQHLQDALCTAEPPASQAPSLNSSPAAWQGLTDWQQRVRPHVSLLAPVPQDLYFL